MGWKGIATFVFLLSLLEFLCDISSLFNVSYCFPFIFKLLYWYLIACFLLLKKKIIKSKTCE